MPAGMNAILPTISIFLFGLSPTVYFGSGLRYDEEVDDNTTALIYSSALNFDENRQDETNLMKADILGDMSGIAGDWKPTRGQHVEARWNDDFWDGAVIQSVSGGRVNIVWDDGSTKRTNLSTYEVRPIDYKTGDRVKKKQQLAVVVRHNGNTSYTVETKNGKTQTWKFSAFNFKEVTIKEFSIPGGKCKLNWRIGASTSKIVLAGQCLDDPEKSRFVFRLVRQGRILCQRTTSEETSRKLSVSHMKDSTVWTFTAEQRFHRFVIEILDYSIQFDYLPQCSKGTLVKHVRSKKDCMKAADDADETFEEEDDDEYPKGCYRVANSDVFYFNTHNYGLFGKPRSTDAKPVYKCERTTPEVEVTYLYVPTEPDCETAFHSGEELRCSPIPTQLVWGGSRHRQVIFDRVLVREEERLTSTAKGTLQKNAVIEVVQERGSRMEYAKLAGRGPARGWISLIISGRQTTRLFKGYRPIIDSIPLVSRRAYAIEIEAVLRRPRKAVLPDISRNTSNRWHKRNDMLHNLVTKWFPDDAYWSEKLQPFRDSNEGYLYQSLVEGLYFPALKSCMEKVMGKGTPLRTSDCNEAAGTSCPLQYFCGGGRRPTKYPVTGDGTCTLRSQCRSGKNMCPYELTDWPWHYDSSVKPMTKEETKDPHQWDGVPIEIVAPGPPDVPLREKTGLRSIVEMMTTVYWMGVQMGPSTGMHVHVNVQNDRVGGDCCLSDTQVARVWVAYAKYQLVMDEFRTPSRVSNKYAIGLLMGDSRIASIFGNIHDFVNGHYHYYKDARRTIPDFCNSALGIQRDPKTLKRLRQGGAFGKVRYDGFVCQTKYPKERYTSLNLHPLGKKGTIEFRRHAGTNDVERALRWVDLVTAFVETFKDDASMDNYFDDNIIDDWRQLYIAQRDATSEEMFTAMRNKSMLNQASAVYFMTHQWASEPVEDVPGVEKGQCALMMNPSAADLTVNSDYEESPLLTTLPLDDTKKACCCHTKVEACEHTTVQGGKCCRVSQPTFYRSACGFVNSKFKWKEVSFDICQVGKVPGIVPRA